MGLLGLDIGTSGCKILAVSADGGVLGEKYIPHSPGHPKSGYAELDSSLIWNNVKRLLQYAAGVTSKNPATALSVSSFGEAVVPVSENREILGHSILGSDVRGEEYSDSLKEQINGEDFYEINPNIISLCYTYPKTAWIRDNNPGLFEKTDKFLHWADFINFMLGAEPYTSNSLANRSLLFNLKKNNWSDELFKRTGMDRDKYAGIADGGSIVGVISRELAGELGLPGDMQLVAGGHDQCLNALGSGAIRPGSAVCGIGTFECITPVFSLMEDVQPLRRMGLNIEHHVLPDLYLSFIYNQAGSLLNWFQQVLSGGGGGSGGGPDILQLEKEIPSEPTGLFTLPYFEPTGSPGFVNDMCGGIIGMKTSTTRGDMFKSIMESVAYYFHEVIQDVSKEGITFNEFTATGGGGKSVPWLQIHADVFGVPFKQPEITEGSALGAALLAGLGTGVWDNAEDAVKGFVKIKQVIEPDMKKHRQYQDLSERYRKIYQGVRSGWV
ncbi:MAG: hypothetical protein DRZ90_08470 [Spirochaetes bacterium]|nr:MAG: hypothetical protein DRZ90_08470 [Spirochaetota bacterium]